MEGCCEHGNEPKPSMKSGEVLTSERMPTSLYRFACAELNSH
jgi:hypothetical protein